MIGNLVGSYKITDKIGEGGMGAVFRGIDVMLEREVAVKMLRPELSQQPNIVERFRSEAVTLAKLNHPNIATLYSFVRQGDDFFMVMEFVRGETLDDLIRRSGAMPVDKAIGLLCQALEGIDHAHRMGIVHRDVKPANMMMTESGTLKVMDFGIARVLGTARMTKQGNIVGTIEYMSPEQVRGQETDARSDIYSLGILLYEMLTGRVPFSSDSEFDLMKMQIDEAPQPPRVFSAQIPQVVEQAIMRALAKRPEARFQSAADFRNSLLSAGGLGAAPSIGSAASATPPANRLGDAPTVIAPVPGAIPKETRLGTGASGFQVDQLKPTRLGGEVNAPLAYGTGSPAPAMYQQAAPPAGKSSAKLFIGIAAVVALVAIVGISLVLLSGGKTQSPVTPSPVTQPVQSSSPTPSAGAGQPSMPAQPPPPQLESPKPTGGGLEGPSYATDETAVRKEKAPKPKGSLMNQADQIEAAARKEKARKAAEARRLLNQ
jgi:serine/threonine-protein kinase